MANTSDYKHFVPPVPLNSHYRESLNLILIETLDQLKESFKKGYVMAWDTETTGLNPTESEIVGFSYSYDGVTAYYCPVKHFDLALGKPALDLFYQALKDAKLQLLYNARFDIRMMEYSGYDMSIMYPKDPVTGQSAPKFIDVMNCSWLSDTNVLMPSLKASTLHFLGHQPPKFLETLGSEQNFQYVPAKQAYEYACFTEDTSIVTKHGLKQIKDLKIGDLVYTSIGYKKLKSILPQGMKKVIKVTTPDHTSFKCTPDHKFAFQVGGAIFWVQAKDLNRISFYQFYRGGVSINHIEEIFEPDLDKYLPSSGCSIEYLEDEEDVYDLSIEDEHNFKLQCGLLAHNCEDAANTYNLFKATYRYYKESGLAAKLDNQCVYIIGQLEKTPLNMDTDYLIKLRDDVYNYVQETEQRIYAIAGHPFKIASNRELTQVFQEQGIDTGERTKAGDMKTSIELLNLYLRNHPDCELLNLLIEYKEKFKLYNSYLKTLVDIAKQQDTVPPRFSYKLQSVPCLTANNLVLLKDKGLVSIKEVKEQDFIWTQYGYKRVLWNNAHKTKDVIRVVFSNGLFIEGTSHHPVLVNNGDINNIKLEWATLGDLRIGESVIFNHHTPIISSDGVDSDLLDFSSLLGILLSPNLITKMYDDYYKEEVKNNLVKLKNNKYVQQLKIDELFSINLLEFITSNKPICWVRFLQGLFTKAFETSIARQWNDESDFSKFYIYSDTPILLTIIMGMLFYLGIPSELRYDHKKSYLLLDSVQSLTLFKNIIVEDSDSTYLKDLFFNYNRSNYFLEYADAFVSSKESLNDEQVVYDIEVEDVHEYVANGVVTHNTGRLSCLSGDTVIPTTLGDIPIEELSLYEDGNEVFIDHKTTAPFHTLYMGEKECVQLNLKNNRNIVCTLDHKFLNSKTEWVEVKDLMVGDILLSVQNNVLTTTSITNIIPKGILPVYTLSVNHPRHQYLSNTLISHNCGKDAKNTYFAPINLQCLEENTIIKTDRGNIPIKNVKEGDLIWTGNRYAPCKPLGSKKEYCYKIKTLWGEIEASLEHQFLTLNYQNYNIEWHTLEECIQNHYPIVRDPQALGSSFDDIYNHPDYRSLYHLRKSLSLEEYKYYLEYYKDYKFDIILECSKEFWNKKLDPVWLKKTVYDLYVPEYNQFTANGYIVHNSIPKPKSIKCYGRKATQEEIEQHLDVLGWVFSPDHPEWSPGKVVEGMSDHLNVRKAFVPEHPENGDYVVSIDMCLEGGSPVQTKRGYMGISELKVGDKVYSPQGWVDVIRVMQTGVKKLIKVLPDNGGQAIYCTEDHHFILNGEKIEAKNIKEPLPTVKFSSWVQNLQDIHILEDKLSDVRWNNIFNGDSTPTSAYLFGYILGDGNLSMRRENYITLNITSKDYQHLVQISNVLGDGVPLRYHEKNGNMWWSIDIPDRNLCGRLIELGISKRKSTEPSNIDFNWLGDNFRHFIRGLFDSDGYVRVTSSLDLNFVGHDLYIKAIQKLINGSWKYKYTDSLSYLFLQGTIDQKKFIYSYLYKDATIWLQRKRDIIEQWYIDKFGDIILPVWNITVDTDEHLYYVNGVLTSNCSEELRIVTNLYSEHNWAEVINSGGDLHHANSDAIFGPENYTKETRKKAKCLSGNSLVVTDQGSYYLRCLCSKRIIGEPIPISYIISTPEGMCQATHFIYNGVQKTKKINFKDGSVLEATHDHLVQSNGVLVPIDKLNIGDFIDGHSYNKEIVSIEDSEDEVFDLTVNNKSHLFYANGCVVHNCAAFGMLYGQEAAGFQRKFPDMSLDEAKEFMTKFKQAIPNITRGQQRTLSEAKRTGTFYTSFGRPRRVKSYLTSSNYREIAFGQRTCKNGIIQGTAADVLKLELVRLWDYVFTQYPEIKWICTIHDEINFSVPRSLANKVIPILVRCMTVKMNNWLIPLDCGLSVGSDLGSIYPFKYNFETKEFVPEWEEDMRKERHEDKDDLEYSDSGSIEEVPIEELDSKMFDL